MVLVYLQSNRHIRAAIFKLVNITRAKPKRANTASLAAYL
jgi:hypothetical protein